MKKTLIAMLALLIAFSCQKKEDSIKPLEAEVVFSAIEVDPGVGLKSTNGEWDCPTDNNGKLLEPAYAEIDIVYGTVTTTYKPEVYRLNGKLYSQAIKLPASETGPTEYTITKFLLRAADHTLIMATPESTSLFAEYITKYVPFTFDVYAFEKAEETAQVLCFLPENYTHFGFSWFQLTEIVIREFCFFGDICLKHPEDYLPSLYGTHQPPVGQTKIDMSALFKVHAYLGDPSVPANELPNSPFTNATADANYGVGAPLCVQYPDDLGVDGEEYTFELYILVKSGSSFIYKYFATFTSTDGGPLLDINGVAVPDVDGDEVTEFVLGSCNYSETDVQLAPYQDLPATCTLVIDDDYAPGPVSGDYMDAIISGITDTGYDLTNGTWGAYCFTRRTGISLNTPYAMDVFSSLYPATLPLYLQDEEWDRLNWLLNHLDDYNWTWSDLQQVFWRIENPAWTGIYSYRGCSPITAVGNQMYADAVAFGDGYVPLPGGWAAVCFVPTGTPPNQDEPLVQTVFVSVDP